LYGDQDFLDHFLFLDQNSKSFHSRVGCDREEIMMRGEMRKIAIQKMALERFHCSQAIVWAGRETWGEIHDDVIRAMGAFGGGLAGNGEVCGALVGGLALLGLKYSRAKNEEKENPRMWQAAYELVSRFRDEIVKREGSILCRDISQVNWKDRDQVKAFYSGNQVKECIKIVGKTADLICEILERT
jgi:C_GCAxxG_C_C family probable redox protein